MLKDANSAHNANNIRYAAGGNSKQEAQLSLRDRATRACHLKSCKLLHKRRRLAFEQL